MPAGTFLDVGRRLVDRHHDRAGRWIGGLAGVDDACGDVVLFLHRNVGATAFGAEDKKADRSA